MQRDLLLVLSAESAQGIDQVRAKLDPLAKKVPAHLTLVFPEPAESISQNLIKELEREGLPSLENLIFQAVEVHAEKYLWLMPDGESREKILKWREALVGKLASHTQGDDFEPHITLGYIPRSMTPEDAVSFARGFISLPVTLKFEKLLLEEFSENQISSALDSLPASF